MPEYSYIAAHNAADGCETHFNASAAAGLVAVTTYEVNLYGIVSYNSNAVDAFLQIFDAIAADITLGTTTPTLSLPIPAGGSSTGGGMDNILVVPTHFSTAMTYAVTTTATGSTPLGANLIVNILFK